MANWNNNGYYGEPWHYPSAGPGAPRQYVGFNDFLHQFQHTPAFPGYPPAIPAQTAPPPSSLQYTNPPYPVTANPQAAFLTNRTPTEHAAGSSYDKENSTSTASTSYYVKSNRRSNNKKKLLEPRSYDNLGEDVASHSKLTATAVEFVPQSARNPRHTVNSPTKGEQSAPLEMSTAEPKFCKNAPEVKNESHRNSQKWKSKNGPNERYNNTNWRSREEDDQWETNSSTNPDQTFTVYNSNRSGQEEGASGSAGPRLKKDNFDKNSNYNEKNIKDITHNNCINQFAEADNGKNQTNMSYNINESFSQRGHVARDEDGWHDDDRRGMEYRRGGDGKRGGDNRGREGGRYGDSRRRGEDISVGDENRRGLGKEDRRNGDSRRGGDNRRGMENWPAEEDNRRRNGDNRRGGEDYRRKEDRSNGENKRGGMDRREGEGGRTRNEYNKKTSARDSLLENTVSQRERLSEQLDRGELECLVCCDRVRQPDPVWACCNCYHVLHLKCVQKWANTSIVDGEWRCPACQNKVRGVPSEYRCFCGARRQPEWVRGAPAHSCGEPCGARRSCALHACALPCHPGPCPPCDASAQRHCECGATTQLLKCSFKNPLLCGDECGRSLNCGAHTCRDKCHPGLCQPCREKVDQKCYCTRGSERSLACDASSVGVDGFSCGEDCGRLRACGNHTCSLSCHPGSCPPCPLAPEAVTHCPCAQTRLLQPRKSCLDPVPVCDKPCSRPLPCGPAEGPHCCQVTCHHGDCPPCPDKTAVNCRCGQLTQDVQCSELEKERDGVRCGRKCTKKQSCGRHRCKERCCVDQEHRCPLPCTRTLSCGLHRCEDTCHRGHCQPCWRISFDEMRCRCGAAVRYPPVECGARPPACTQPCPEVRNCGHEPHHSCHPQPSACPPCVVLTQRYCHGRHKMRKTIPCHQEDFSCGLPCGKDLTCGKHKCIETCHKGPCLTVCSQRCAEPRPGCGHACAAPCTHAAPCPTNTLCRAVVPASCPCGRRTLQRPCHEQRAILRRITALPGPLGEPVDISALLSQGNTSVTLECDLECQVEDRNRRLAIGLQIRNPDLSAKLAPKYSDSIKQMATREENFAQRVHEQLTQLVSLSRESKQRTRSHSFAPMSRQRRQFVHELCQHFGCDSAAYDAEPYRNIVATAYKDKSWLPALSVLEVLRRERGQRKVPGPVLPSGPTPRTGSAWATLGPAPVSAPPEPPRKPRIDYFDTPPED